MIKLEYFLEEIPEGNGMVMHYEVEDHKLLKRIGFSEDVGVCPIHWLYSVKTMVVNTLQSSIAFTGQSISLLVCGHGRMLKNEARILWEELLTSKYFVYNDSYEIGVDMGNQDSTTIWFAKDGTVRGSRDLKELFGDFNNE